MLSVPGSENFDLQKAPEAEDDSAATSGPGIENGASDEFPGLVADERDELLEDIEKSSTLSVFGASLAFKGTLVADEDLLIQGTVHGSIEHDAENLTIGVNGKVTADIRARSVLVQGDVKGDIYATERIVVEASAHVTGDLFSPSIGLKEGARFKGSIDMDGPPSRSSAAAPAKVSSEPAPVKVSSEPAPVNVVAETTSQDATGTSQPQADRKKTKRRSQKKAASATGDDTVSDSVVDATLLSDSEAESTTETS